MAKRITDLQKLVEDRASKKLLREIKVFADRMKNEPLLTVEGTLLYLGVALVEADNKVIWKAIERYELYKYYGSCERPDDLSLYLRRLYDYHLPAYIERESKDFLTKVDEYAQQINSLREDIDNLYNQSHSSC